MCRCVRQRRESGVNRLLSLWWSRGRGALVSAIRQPRPARPTRHAAFSVIAEPQACSSLSVTELQDTKGNRDDGRIVFKIFMMEEVIMPRGDKSKYTDKQERKADHMGPPA